jgi:hypothetical protein
MKYSKILASPKSIIGLTISIAAIYWAFRDFEFDEFTESLSHVQPIYLLAATVMLWISVWFRGIRWKWLFKEENSPTTSSLYKAELIGYFGNNVLPLRLGELLRSYLVGKEWNLSKGFVVGTVVLERLLDTLSLAVLSLLLLFVFPLEEPVKTYVITGGFLSIIGVFTALLFIGKIRNLSSQHRLVTIIKNIFDGLLSIRKEVVLHVMLSSLIIWLIYWLDVYLIQLAFQLQLSWSQSLFILVISSLALSIPSAPGMIGTFHAAVKYAIVDVFAYSPAVGNSFAILMHAYGYILLTGLGAYYFMKSQFHNHAIDEVMQ